MLCIYHHIHQRSIPTLKQLHFFFEIVRIKKKKHRMILFLQNHTYLCTTKFRFDKYLILANPTQHCPN